MSLREAIIDLLRENELDNDVLDYLTGIITEHDDDDGSIEDICDSLAGFSPHFATVPPDEQQAGAVALLQLRLAPAAPPAPFSAPTSRRQSEAESRDFGAAAETSKPQTPRESPPDPPLSPQEEEAVALLSSLCPCPLPEGFLLDLFRDQGGSRGDPDALQTAANRILETSPEALRAEAAAWTAAATAAQNKAGKGGQVDDGRRTGLDASPLREVDEELRRSIVARFHLEAVPKSGSGGGGKNGGGSSGIAAWGALPVGGKKGGSGEERKNQVRYRDGVVVSTKGEKVIIEKPPEWDGGSRGKVKSKRKGGVGWH